MVRGDIPQSALEFLPTPSARRATLVRQDEVGPGHISTHALREEGDLCWPEPMPQWRNFYPRPP